MIFSHDDCSSTKIDVCKQYLIGPFCKLTWNRTQFLSHSVPPWPCLIQRHRFRLARTHPFPHWKRNIEARPDKKRHLTSRLLSRSFIIIKYVVVCMSCCRPPCVCRRSSTWSFSSLGLVFRRRRWRCSYDAASTNYCWWNGLLPVEVLFGVLPFRSSTLLMLLLMLVEKDSVAVVGVGWCRSGSWRAMRKIKTVNWCGFVICFPLCLALSEIEHEIRQSG